MAKGNTKQEKDHRSNQLNQNTGTSGANKENSQVQGNRSKQLEEAKKEK
jgi:hypothetical protein